MKHCHIYQAIRERFNKINFIFLVVMLLTLSLSCSGPQAQIDQTSIQTSLMPLPGLQLQEPLRVADSDNARFKASYLNLPLQFEANQGQTDPSVKYLSRGSCF